MWVESNENAHLRVGLCEMYVKNDDPSKSTGETPQLCLKLILHLFILSMILISAMIIFSSVNINSSSPYLPFSFVTLQSSPQLAMFYLYSESP